MRLINVGDEVGVGCELAGLHAGEVVAVSARCDNHVERRVVIGHRLAVTPDRLVGRVESVRTTISLLVGAVGPLVAGLVLAATSARATVAVFATVGVGLALWGTLSPSIRAAPRLGDLGPG